VLLQLQQQHSVSCKLRYAFLQTCAMQATRKASELHWKPFRLLKRT
jgi:hypothetical protein